MSATLAPAEPDVRHVGDMAACQCACGGYLLVHRGYIDGRPMDGIRRVVERHRQTELHIGWAQRTYGMDNAGAPLSSRRDNAA